MTDVRSTHVRCLLSATLSLAVALATAPVLPTAAVAAPIPAPLPMSDAAADAVAAALLPILRVQSCEGNCEPNERNYERRSGSDRDPRPTATGPGNKVSRYISARTAECLRYTEIWRVDCLSDTLQQAARALPNAPQYAEARKEIALAANQLQRIADRYADPKVAAKVRVSRSGRSTARPIVAIRPEAVATANAQAEAVVNDLATTLLRSAPTATTAAQITAVAASVDSTLVLLRSS